MEKKQQNVAETLVELLKEENEDFMALTNVRKLLSKDLKTRLKLTSDANAGKIEKALSPYLGDVLAVKKGSRSKYLTFRQSDEDLLFGILQKRAGKSPSANNLPFKKDEYANTLTRLSGQGRIRVDFNPKTLAPLIFPIEGHGSAGPEPRTEVSEENFKAAYQTLGRGKVQVRICEMRRHLGWSVPDFNKTLIELRDAEEIDLQGGDTDFYTDEDIRDSFVDENGFRKLNIMWRK